MQRCVRGIFTWPLAQSVTQRLVCTRVVGHAQRQAPRHYHTQAPIQVLSVNVTLATASHTRTQ